MKGIFLLGTFVMGGLGCHESEAPTSHPPQREQQVREFWADFRGAVESGNLDQVPDFVLIPMDGAYETRQDLVDDFEWVLSTEVRKEIVSTTFDGLEPVSGELGNYWEFCYHNGVDSEGQYTVTYHIAFVGEGVRIIRIFAAG